MNFTRITLKENLMIIYYLQTQTVQFMNLKQIIFYEDKYLLDFSDYPQDSNFFDHVNKKVIDQMKGEFKGKLLVKQLD